MRWIIRIAGILLAAALLALGLVLFLPGERIARIAADQLKTQTGRELSFGGEVSITIWPELGVRTGPVSLANADWAGPEPMLRAQSLSVGVAAGALLRGDIRVTRIAAEAPELRLATGPDGRGNWEFGTPGPPLGDNGAAGGTTAPVTVEELQLRDARLIYTADGAEPMQLSGLDLDLAWPDPGGPARISARLRGAGDPIELAARVDGFGAFLIGAQAPVSVTLTAPGGRLDFEGRADIAGRADGQVSLKADDSTQMLAAAGFSGLDPPPGLGRTADVTAQISHAGGGRLTLRDLAATLDGNALSGQVDIIAGMPARISAELVAGALDFGALDGARAAAGAGAAAGADTGGWPDDPIDAGALALVDGSVALTAQSIDTGLTRLGPTRVLLRLDAARAVLELTQVSVFDGTLSGELVANGRGGFSVAGRLRADGIEMRQALGDLTGIDRLSGRASGNLEFQGGGGSVDAIMRSLSGKGGLEMGRGMIAGIDLDRLMRSGDVGGGTTVFDSLTASYAITSGNLQNDDLLLQLANFRADGGGRVGLGTRDIDYLFTPVALRANAGRGLAIPVRIRGPWSAPAILPDLSQALQSGIEVNTDALEERAKTRLKEKLNLAPGDGQSTEDAIRNKLEDEARKGLLRLLGQD